MQITLKTLTPLWTGGIDQTPDRLHETGLIGSLRWWYEALVRGLGGYACDPTSEDRCPDKDGKHCVACELFGCTGWARKFRIQTLSPIETVQIKGNLVAIKKGQKIEMEFIPLRLIAEEEWCLLQMTLRLISEYGAMGGKTIFKPSDQKGREHEFHHLDFGLVKIQTTEKWSYSKDLDALRAYVIHDRWRKGNHRSRNKKHDYSWVSLQNFWCVKGHYLARQGDNHSTFNSVLGRHESKNRAKSLSNNSDQTKWLAGSQQESKRVFSFKHPVENGRTFGFVKPGLISFDEMKGRLKQVWKDCEKDFLTGSQILNQLCSRDNGGAS